MLLRFHAVIHFSNVTNVKYCTPFPTVGGSVRRNKSTSGPLAALYEAKLPFVGSVVELSFDCKIHVFI